MKIPKTFRLGGCLWRVKHVAVAAMPFEYGHCDMESHTIRLQKGLEPQLAQDVFFHELVHAVLWAAGDERYSDEQYVSSRANLLHQALTTAK